MAAKKYDDVMAKIRCTQHTHKHLTGKWKGPSVANVERSLQPIRNFTFLTTCFGFFEIRKSIQSKI